MGCGVDDVYVHTPGKSAKLLIKWFAFECDF